METSCNPAIGQFEDRETSWCCVIGRFEGKEKFYRWILVAKGVCWAKATGLDGGTDWRGTTVTTARVRQRQERVKKIIPARVRPALGPNGSTTCMHTWRRGDLTQLQKAVCGCGQPGDSWPGSHALADSPGSPAYRSP